MKWLRELFSGRPTEAERAYLDQVGYAANFVKIDAENAVAVRRINALMQMSDEEFVFQVRRIEQEGPEWVTLVKWHEFVKRETNFRLLLKGTPCT